MVISNLNIKLIEDRLGFINEALAKLKRLSTYKEEEFLKEDNPAIAESYLRRSLDVYLHSILLLTNNIVIALVGIAGA